MDLGLSGKTAIVCASSKGLGLGCALALAEEGANVVLNGRSADSLAAAEAAVRAVAGAGTVTAVAADVTTAEGRETLLAAAPNPDILVNNAGGPPPGDFRDWGQEDWMKALNANLYSPVALIEATIDGMIERRFGRIVNITSAAEASNTGDILDHVSDRYSDDDGMNKKLLQGMLARQFLTRGALIVVLGPIQVERQETTATARFDAVLAEGAADLGLSADALHFEVELVLEDGEWKVLSHSRSPVAP